MPKSDSTPHVPPATVQRLPLYLRCLVEAQSQRMQVISSVQIAEMAGTNAAQVRKDFSYLGEYGTRGLGYDVSGLVSHLGRWLGLDHIRHAAIVGYGRLGAALLGYGGFQDRGVSIVAVLDADTDKVGRETPTGLVVQSLGDLASVVEREGIEIAIIAVPAAVAQEVADASVAAGIRAVLNFAPVKLETPPGVVVRQADMAGELQILSFHLAMMDATS